MTTTLRELFRHNTWATLRLLDFCQGLSDDALDLTTGGVYGTIRATLRHLVAAEERYYWTVSQVRAAEPLPDGPAPIADLAERARRLGPLWERIIEDAELPDREVIGRDGWHMLAAVPMTQAIHHANEHRAHVLSILGAHGMEGPDLSVWGYAEASELMHPLANTTE